MRIKGNLLLLMTALIWGLAFVAQISGMDFIGPFAFNFARNIVASITLGVFVFLRNRQEGEQKNENTEDKTIIGGIWTGIALALAMAFQQLGIMESSAGKAGFITALYIVIVPVLGVFIGKSVSSRKWIAVILATIGLYLLTVKQGFTINRGDILLFICAVFYSFHILVIDYFSPKSDPFKLSMIQFIVAAVVSGVFMVFFETGTWSQIVSAWIPLLYLGIMSSGVGYTVQVYAQKFTDPTSASLILSLESVFAALFGGLILGERLAAQELIGAAIMFSAIILSQLPQRERIK